MAYPNADFFGTLLDQPHVAEGPRAVLRQHGRSGFHRPRLFCSDAIKSSPHYGDYCYGMRAGSIFFPYQTAFDKSGIGDDVRAFHGDTLSRSENE